MRKGAVQQVFIYMMVIVIAGAVLLIGYSSIESLIERSCEVEKTNFLSRLERAFTGHERVGSSSIVELSAPCDYDLLCFVNFTASADNVDLQDEAMEQVIRDNLAAGTGMNVFIGDSRSAEAILSKGGLEVENSAVICINSTRGIFEFRLTGIGRGRTLVSGE